MYIPKFKVTIENSKLSVIDKDRFNMFLSTLDGKYNLLIEKIKKSRSINQNNYFHGPFLDGFSDASGYSVTKSKQVLKYQFLRTEFEVEIDGKIEKMVHIRSTGDLTTVEFEDFLQKGRELAYDQYNGYEIPLPE